jgi:AraC-like DNA-binding protein
VVVFECTEDRRYVAMPRPEVQLVVRFGTSGPDGIDIHAFGVRQSAHRKLIRAGQRSVTARLRLDAPPALLGVPASELAGRIVALEDLWGGAASRSLIDQLGDARDTFAAAAVLERALGQRLTGATSRPAHAQLALAAAERLASANLNVVAADLGVSERHLRRVFHRTVGVSPKAFAKLARFHRALLVARENGSASWASIAATAGYYDQAHLIAEFRALAGATPRALLGELAGFSERATR